jgi:hypothetical protein
MNGRQVLKQRYIYKKDTIILCEDEKSSYYYLKELVKEYRRGSVIDVRTTKGKAPKQMIDSAIELKNSKTVKGLYCVFDIDKIKRNELGNFHERELNAYIKKAYDNDVKCIVCDPNFEFYLLLNFEEINSVNENEIKNKLVGYFPGKNIEEIKSDGRLFAKLIRNKNNLVKAMERNERTFNNGNNRTNFFEIIRFIIKKSF